MNLPKKPYELIKHKRAVESFRGIDRRPGAGDGSISDGYGVCSDEYPYIKSAPGVARLSDGDDYKDMLITQGHIFAIRDAYVYMDGDKICPYDGGKKLQVAIVNTKAFILPGNYLCDINDKTYTKLGDVRSYDAVYSCGDGSTTFVLPYSGKGKKRKSWYGAGYKNPWTYVYKSNDPNKTDIEALKECFENGEWNKTALESLTPIAVCLVYTDEDISGGCFIPDDYGQPNVTWLNPPTRPRELYNSTGDVGIFDGKRKEDGNTYSVSYRILSEVPERPYLGETDEGIMLKIEGTPGGLLDTQAIPTNITYDDGNLTATVTFDGEIFPTSWKCFVNTVYIQKGEYDIACEPRESGMTYTPVYKCQCPNIPPNTAIYVKIESFYDQNVSFFYVQDGKELSFKGDRVGYTHTHSYDDSFIFKPIGEATDGGYLVSADVSVLVPKLDFICERQNRLCGVSNEDKTVYVSALGLPESFYDYDGDDGAFAVAVGSAGDFTGITNFNGALCCFKENGVYKLIGDVPSGYYSAEYQFSGVAKGAGRSIVQAADGSLIYKGKDGFYRYTGSYPARISDTLGTLYGGAEAVLCKDKYIAQVGKEMYELDLTHGVFYVRRKGECNGLSANNDRLCFIRDGYLYGEEEGVREEFSFEIPLVFDKRNYHTPSSFVKKGYLRVYARVKLGMNAYMDVYTLYADKAERRVCTLNKQGEYSSLIPLAPERDDGLKLKFSGRGDVTLLGIEREFITGSEKT